jgi:hypothetical protein
MIDISPTFRGLCCLHLQGKKIYFIQMMKAACERVHSQRALGTGQFYLKFISK